MHTFFILPILALKCNISNCHDEIISNNLPKSLNDSWGKVPSATFRVLISEVISDYNYYTSSFNKTWTQILHTLKSYSQHDSDLRWWWVSLTVIQARFKDLHLLLVNHSLKITHHYFIKFQEINNNFIFRSIETSVPKSGWLSLLKSRHKVF